MDKYICQICREQIVEHAHFWKEHHLKEADYFHRYCPRYSKQTGELIKFKSLDFYLNSDFNDKKEMMAWFKANPDKAQDYAIELLKQRRDRKKLVYAPSQVELRSLMLPSMIWFKKNFDSYTKLCFSVGLKPKFTREDEIIRYSPLKENAILITDSREQNPLLFKNIKTEVIGLPYGDYTLKPNRLKIYIERKSVSDFAGTFGTNYERFKREVERAKKDKAYLIILVENLLSKVLNFNYLPQMKFSKVNPDFCFHNVRDLLQSYHNIQFLFCNGRREAIQLVLKIFQMVRHPKHVDLQWLYDTNKI